MKKQKWGPVITLILIITLVTLIVGCIKMIHAYYHSPNYVVDQYINYLNKRQYDNLYKIIDLDSITDFSNKEELKDYYQKIYDRQHHLVCAFRKSRVNDPYYIQCQCEDKLFSYSLKLNHKRGKWYIEFPFEKSGIKVIAPYGSTVYVDHFKAEYNAEGFYEIKELLPANYMLAVNPNENGYKPYYEKVSIPSNKIYKAPYKMGTLKVRVPGDLKVKCHHFNQYASKGKVTFNNMLLGSYKLDISDERGYIRPIELDIDLNNTTQEVVIRGVQLSATGNKEIKEWLDDFYAQCKIAIIKHDGDYIREYFKLKNRHRNIELFNKWFVDNKNISEASMGIDITEIGVTKSGEVDVQSIETIELTNQEIEDETQVEKNYKLILYCHTVIDIWNKPMQIIDKYIDQNIIAVKSIDGEWIQY